MPTLALPAARRHKFAAFVDELLQEYPLSAPSVPSTKRPTALHGIRGVGLPAGEALPGWVITDTYLAQGVMRIEEVGPGRHAGATWRGAFRATLVTPHSICKDDWPSVLREALGRGHELRPSQARETVQRWLEAAEKEIVRNRHLREYFRHAHMVAQERSLLRAAAYLCAQGEVAQILLEQILAVALAQVRALQRDLHLLMQLERRELAAAERTWRTLARALYQEVPRNYG